MRSKLLALLLGMLLLGAAAYFRSPALPVSEETVESEESPARPAIPAKQGLFQTVSFHPSDISAGQLSKESILAPLNTQEAEAHWESIATLVTCATNPKNCAETFPETDPSSRFFAIRDRILDETDWFLSHKASGPQQAAQALEAAQYLMTVPDEQVQANGLKMALMLPPSAKTCEIIAANMADVVDTSMVPDMMLNLGRCLNPSNEQSVINFVCDTITTGSLFASKEMAKNIDKVLTDSTRGRLETCANKMEKSEREQSMRRILYPSSASI